jgi:hypothetical protein
MLMVNQLTGFGARRAAGGGGTSAEVAAFLARTSGLDSTHINAYTDLIDGLVADGIWSKLDMLHVYATQDSTTALLNLVSTSFNGTANGSPTFTADRGFTGTNGSSTIYINTGFNATTAPSPNYIQDSAHISAWSVTNVGTSANPMMGAYDSGGNKESDLYPKYTDNNTYIRVNAGGGLPGAANSDPTGHYLASRTGSTALSGYKNGSSLLSNTSASHAPANLNVYTLGSNKDGTANGSPHQCAMASIGSGLSSTDITNFYDRLRTFMTAVGVP